MEQLDENTELEIVEEEGDWYKVKYESDEGTVTGYVSKEYVKADDGETETTTEPEETEDPVEQPEETTEEPEPEPVEEPVDNTEVTESEHFEEGNEAKLSKDTNLRTVPSFSSRAITVIPNGTTVQVLDRLNNWVKVTDGTNTGWIVNV